MIEEVKNEEYDYFIRQGLNIGFTDDQIDFLWEMRDWFYAEGYKAGSEKVIHDC